MISVLWIKSPRPFQKVLQGPTCSGMLRGTPNYYLLSLISYFVTNHSYIIIYLYLSVIRQAPDVLDAVLQPPFLDLWF